MAGTAGPNGPSFVYVLSYASYEERESQWQAFGKDADWAKVRIETVAKEEMTERVERMFITPSPAWTPPESSPAQTIGGLHELILAEVPLGHAGHATTYLRDICIPLIERLGGRVMMVADVTVGCETAEGRADDCVVRCQSPPARLVRYQLGSGKPGSNPEGAAQSRATLYRRQGCLYSGTHGVRIAPARAVESGVRSEAPAAKHSTA